MDDLATIVGTGPVLVLAPHADDESLGCGGLLAACWAGGVPAHVACLTDGAASHPGSRDWPPARLAEQRRQELRDAIVLLGGDPRRDLTFLDHPDANLHRIPEGLLARQIETLVDDRGASVLLVPSRHDPHCDHVAAAEAAEAVAAARPSLRLLSYPIWSRWNARPEAAPLSPASRRVAFDTAPFRDAKARAVAAHASQDGRVVHDDDGGFVLPDGFTRAFVVEPEIFDLREGAPDAG